MESGVSRILDATAVHDSCSMMTSSNGNIFRVTGLMWGESTGDRWIPLVKASDAEFWYFLCSAHEQTVEQTIETPMILDAIALIIHCNALGKIIFILKDVN